MRRIFLTLTALLAVGIGLSAKTWEPVRQDQQVDRQATERIISDQPEITLNRGEVYITTTRPVTVKVFSILGQLVSQETIPAGTYKLNLSTRGVYILKIGSLTRRVTI